MTTTTRPTGAFSKFYDPTGARYGLPTYPYSCAPDGLATIRQLRAAGLRPGGHDPVAQILWRNPRHGIEEEIAGKFARRLLGVLKLPWT